MQASLGKHQHHHHDPYDHYHLHHRRHDPYEARKRYDSFHCRYSLASADVDADGLADLFVGAPFYHKVSQLLITMVIDHYDQVNLFPWGVFLSCDHEDVLDGYNAL